MSVISTIRTSALAAVLGLLAVASPNAADFTGVYVTRDPLGQVAAVQIQQTENRFVAAYNDNGRFFTVQGDVDGDACVGVMYDATQPAAGSLAFVGLYQAEALLVTICPIRPDGAPQMDSPLAQLSFVPYVGEVPVGDVPYAGGIPSAGSGGTGGSAGPATASRGPDGPLDSGLLGTWFCGGGYSSTNYGGGNYSMSTSQTITFHPDGTVVFGAGQVAGGGDYGSVYAGGGSGTASRWYTQTNGAQTFLYIDGQYYCRYAFAGTALGVYFGNDTKPRVWSRD